jgi:hypothetical protein
MTRMKIAGATKSPDFNFCTRLNDQAVVDEKERI